jgi:hypothetical protein
VFDCSLELLIVRHKIVSTVRWAATLVALLPCFYFGQAMLLGRLVAIDAQELFHRDHLF